VFGVSDYGGLALCAREPFRLCSRVRRPWFHPRDVRD